MRNLPHDPYITAVCDALTEAGLELTDHCWTDDGETRGTYCYLNAVITLDPSGTIASDDEDIPVGTPWPHGLLPASVSGPSSFCARRRSELGRLRRRINGSLMRSSPRCSPGAPGRACPPSVGASAPPPAHGPCAGTPRA